MLTKIALRNIFRNRRRSAITLAVIVFGAVGLILFGGYKAITFHGLRESTIRRIGHLQVFRAGYHAAESPKPLEYGIENAQELRARIEKDPRVKSTAAQITLMGLISNGDKSETFVATAVEDVADRDTVLLGAGLAKSMKVKEGDYITLLTTTAAGSLNAMDLRVAGTFASGVKELDERAVKMHLNAAQELLQSTKIEKLLVFLHETPQTDAARAALEMWGRPSARPMRGLKPAPHSIEIKSWSELASFYHQVVLLYNGIFSFLGLIVFGVVVFSVANTIVMSIFERTREIGTLMAIGTGRARVWRMFFLEGLLIGVIGGVLGLAFGAGLAELINSAKVMLPPPPGYTVGYELRILLDPRVLAITFFISVFTATVSSIVPAFRASRMQIVDALGHI